MKVFDSIVRCEYEVSLSKKLNIILKLDQLPWIPIDQTSQILWPFIELDLYRIARGFHWAFATGVACQGTLTLPDTWFRPCFGLANAQFVETSFSELAMIFPDLLSWQFLGTVSAFADNNIFWVCIQIITKKLPESYERGRVVTLLACGGGGPDFNSLHRDFNIRDWV